MQPAGTRTRPERTEDPPAGAAAPLAPEDAIPHHRPPLLSRLNAWRKRSPFNPYWIDVRELRRAMSDLAAHASGRLLDVGVGERPYAEFFEPRVERYIGLEYPPVADNLSPEIWEHLERLEGIVDVFGDGMRLPFVDGSFDTALLAEVLEHVPEPDRMVSELARVLRPGGRLLLTVPFASALHQLPFDYGRYTPLGVEQILRRHGLEPEHVVPRGNYASVMGSLLSNQVLRLLGARRLRHDGGVTLSRWRAPLVLPLVALVQVFFAGLARLSHDTALCSGYLAVARKPE